MAAGLILVSLAGNVIRLLPQGAASQAEIESAMDLARIGRSEERLAVGEKLKLADVDIAALELVPRLPVKIAERVVRSKAAIARRARTLPEGERYRAFTMIFGVGPKTALLLDGAIELGTDEGNAIPER